MPTMRIPHYLAALSAALTFSSAAHGWGAEGHRLIGELAEAQLTPAARAEVHRLLALEPGATLASVATWADEVRSPATAAWHYVNPPLNNCSYERQRDCDDGNCAVEALLKKAAALASSATDEQRLSALKWVVHLVGDLHQPLHAGFREDKGANLYQVQAFGRGTNLHAVWDGALIRHRRGGVDALRSSASTSHIAEGVSPQPAAWAIESCQFLVAPGFYPEDRLVTPGYAEQWDQVNRPVYRGGPLV